MNLNKAIIIGNITRDPELKSLESGMRVCKFGVATNRTYKDKNGNKQESTEFHNIVSFGKTAENINQYMKKGDLIYVEGRISARSWEQEGIKRYTTEIIAEMVQFGPNRQPLIKDNQYVLTDQNLKLPTQNGDIIDHTDNNQANLSEISTSSTHDMVPEEERNLSLDEIPF